MQEKRDEHRKALTYYLRAFENGDSRLFGYVANVSDYGVLIVGKRPYERGSLYRLSIALPEQKSQNKHFFVEAICKWSQGDATSEFFSSGFKTARPVGHLASAETGTLSSKITLKRIFDVLASILGMLVASPLYLLVGLAIRLNSDDPLLYSAERIGIYGRPFRIYKFRTMSVAAGDDGPAVTAHDDPRITRLGRFLRQTKLNELPQLFNVLRGDMTFVGPRPEYAEFVAHYTPGQREVLSVKPGITSLATILYAGEEKMLNFSEVTETYLRSILPDKLRLDLLYIRNQSLLLDLDILFHTMLVLIPRFRRAAPQVEDILRWPFRITRQRLSWFAIDAAVAFLGVSLAGLLWRSAGPIEVGIGRSLIAAFLMTAIFTITNWITGVQRVQWRYANPSEAIYVIGSASAATTLVLIANSLVGPPQFPDAMLIMAGIFALSGFLVVRYLRPLFQGLTNKMIGLRTAASAGQERVLIVGAGDAAQLTILLVHNNPAGRGFHIVGVVDDDPNLLGTLLHRAPVLGVCDRIPEIVREKDIGTIVFAIHSIEDHRRRYLLRRCRETRARTVIVPNLLSNLRQGVVWEVEAPGRAVGDSQPATSFAGTSADLRRQIQILAAQARKGDIADVARGLGQLDKVLAAEETDNLVGIPKRRQSRTKPGPQVSA